MPLTASGGLTAVRHGLVWPIYRQLVPVQSGLSGFVDKEAPRPEPQQRRSLPPGRGKALIIIPASGAEVSPEQAFRNDTCPVRGR